MVAQGVADAILALSDSQLDNNGQSFRKPTEVFQAPGCETKRRRLCAAPERSSTGNLIPLRNPEYVACTLRGSRQHSSRSLASVICSVYWRPTVTKTEHRSAKEDPFRS